MRASVSGFFIGRGYCGEVVTDLAAVPRSCRQLTQSTRSKNALATSILKSRKLPLGSSGFEARRRKPGYAVAVAVVRGDRRSFRTTRSPMLSCCARSLMENDRTDTVAYFAL